MMATASRGRRTTWVACVALLLVLVGSLSSTPTVAASTYPLPLPILTVAPNPISTNTPFETTISGVTPGETITFYFEGNDPITVTAGADGTATVTFITPPTPGTYDITAVLGSGGVILVGSVRVVASGGTATAIPRTGSDSTLSVLWVGLGLVAFGGAFVVVARLRRRDDVPTTA